VQQRTRRRVLRLFKRRDLLSSDVVEDMLKWSHAGGFSVDVSVLIEARDRRGLERLLRYCARPVLALERLHWCDERHERLVYHLPKVQADGRTALQFTPLELIHCLAQLLPPPRKHRHRYYGVFAPNAPLWTAVAALTSADTNACPPEPAVAAPAARLRPANVSLWAILLARIYEIAPLVCSRCGGPVRIVAFLVETASISQILRHIGEPTVPPALYPPRGPPDELLANPIVCLDDDVNQDRYAFEADQRLSW